MKAGVVHTFYFLVIWVSLVMYLSWHVHDLSLAPSALQKSQNKRQTSEKSALLSALTNTTLGRLLGSKMRAHWERELVRLLEDEYHTLGWSNSDNTILTQFEFQILNVNVQQELTQTFHRLVWSDLDKSVPWQVLGGYLWHAMQTKLSVTSPSRQNAYTRLVFGGCDWLCMFVPSFVMGKSLSKGGFSGFRFSLGNLGGLGNLQRELEVFLASRLESESVYVLAPSDFWLNHANGTDSQTLLRPGHMRVAHQLAPSVDTYPVWIHRDDLVNLLGCANFHSLSFEALLPRLCECAATFGVVVERVPELLYVMKQVQRFDAEAVYAKESLKEFYDLQKSELDEFGWDATL